MAEEESNTGDEDIKSVICQNKTTSNSKITIKRSKAWYMVILMSLCYGIGELSHFLVGTTSRYMSQDLQYGDQSCLRNNSISAELGSDNATCSDYQTQET